MSRTEKTHPAGRISSAFLFERTPPASKRLRIVYVAILTLLWIALATNLRADTISGTIKDPSGGVVTGARVEITGGNLSKPIVLATYESGKFAAPNLPAGKYSVVVVKDGFDNLVTAVDLKGSADLQLSLTITAQQTSVNVTEKNMAFANSDSVYRQLRDVGLGDSYRCENFTLHLDVGTFELKFGTLTLLGAVDKFVTGAIFVGQGHFTLKPVLEPDTRELLRRTGAPAFEEDLSDVVFRFTPKEYSRFSAALGAKTQTSPEAAAAFQRWKEKVRKRHEVPEGFTQAILEGETIDNVDADLLAAIYNPGHPPFINAYMHGAHKDLRFFIRTRVGALPQMDSPEEVALVSCGGSGMDDGIWYSQHLVSELKAQKASSLEDRRLFATTRYNSKP